VDLTDGCSMLIALLRVVGKSSTCLTVSAIFKVTDQFADLSRRLPATLSLFSHTPQPSTR
jgi:hypothetical protein